MKELIIVTIGVIVSLGLFLTNPTTEGALLHISVCTLLLAWQQIRYEN